MAILGSTVVNGNLTVNGEINYNSVKFLDGMFSLYDSRELSAGESVTYGGSGTGTVVYIDRGRFVLTISGGATIKTPWQFIYLTTSGMSTIAANTELTFSTTRNMITFDAENSSATLGQIPIDGIVLQTQVSPVFGNGNINNGGLKVSVPSGYTAGVSLRLYKMT